MSKKKIYKDVKKFTIKRSKWSRAPSMLNAPGNWENSLLNPDGTKCCLGFYADSCGLQSKDIKCVSSPMQVINIQNKNWDTFLTENLGNEYEYNAKDCVELIDINDDPTTTDKFKEKQIAKIFEKHGVKVKFIK